MSAYYPPSYNHAASPEAEVADEEIYEWPCDATESPLVIRERERLQLNANHNALAHPDDEMYEVHHRGTGVIWL